MVSTSCEDLVVECSDLTHVYEAPTPVVALDHCRLEVRRGDFVAIMGPSGSGKSTLLNCLGLVDRPSSGSYRLAGREMTGLNNRERATARGRLVGFVFQSYHLVARRDVVENIGLGLLYRRIPRRTRLHAAAETARQVGLEHRLGTPVEKLSGGEQQRVAIGRALVGGPALVLADEPTGNLDSENTDLVLGLLARLNDRGHTIVMVTHDRDVADSAQHRFTLVDGRLSQRP